MVDIGDGLWFATVDLDERFNGCFGVRVIEARDYGLGRGFTEFGRSILRVTWLLGLHLGSP